MRCAVWRRAFLLGLACAAIPLVASAHPLGNFTINHYAGIRVAAHSVALDVVIDMAEIPTFQERQRIDADGDGTVSDAEASRERLAACERLAPELHLQVGGSRLRLRVDAAGLSFPAGAGGLRTMRLVCEYDAPIAGGTRSQQSLHFEDSSYAERIGWREIVVEGDGVKVNGEHAASSISHRLTRYPAELLSTPRDDRSIDLQVAAGGDQLAPARIPDAQPMGQPARRTTPSLAASVPGGVQLTALLGNGDLSVAAILLSLLLAAGLGALHALSPGHGKTVMAAYLVGSRGTARHAVVLGLIVTAAHTMGVVGLALVTLLASDFLPPERLYPILGLSSGAIVIGIGVYLLAARWRAVSSARRHRLDHAHGGDHGHEHHHEHALPAGTTLSWGALFSLGLAGGLVPSASALLLLLGAIAIGKPAYGLALAIAFGAGMAVVLSGIGILMVRASRLVERMPRLGGLWRFNPAIPWLTAVVVLGAGIYLTTQALAQPL